MSRRNLLLLLLAASIAFVALAFTVHPTNETDASAHPNASTACELDTSPCIKVTEANGTIYKLNDFRFAPGHCLNFISLPDKMQRQTCGNYHMDWIGPN